MKAKTMTKRALALVLCVVMLVSCWVFTAPTANAEESLDTVYLNKQTNFTSEPTMNGNPKGQYKIRVMLLEDTDWFFFDWNNIDNTVHANISSYTPGIEYTTTLTGTKRKTNGTKLADDVTVGSETYWCEYARITYKTMNGSSNGTTAYCWFNIGDTDSTGKTDILGGGGVDVGYFPSRNGVLINGFPTGLYTYIYKTDTANKDYYYAYLQIATWNTSTNKWEWKNAYGGNSDNNATDYASGTGINSRYKCGLISLHPGNNNKKAEALTGTGSTVESNYPIAQSTPTVTYKNGSTTTTTAICPKTASSTTTRTLSFAAPLDQYNVEMAATINVSCSEKKTGITQDGLDTKIAYNANIDGTTDKQTVTANLVWPQYTTSSQKSAEKTLTVYDYGKTTSDGTATAANAYTINWKTYDGTTNAYDATTRQIYGHTFTIPDVPDRDDVTVGNTVGSTRYTYDDSKHYYGKNWVESGTTTSPTSLTEVKKDVTYVATDSSATHTYNQTTVRNATTQVVAPTCTTPGQYVKTCVCGKVDPTKDTTNATLYTATTEPGIALGHDWSSDWSSDASQHWHACKRDAGHKNNLSDHDTTGQSWVNTDPATHWKACKDCGYERLEEAAHTWAYTSNGDKTFSHQKYCSVCGYVAATAEACVGADGQEEDRHEATCTEDGYYKLVTRCGLCNGLISDPVVKLPKTGHDIENVGWTNTDPDTHWKECKNDSSHHLLEEEHSFGAWDYSNPAQRTQTCLICGYVKTDAHTYTEVVTPATCTDRGYTTYTCSTCGYSYEGNYTDALGHDVDGVALTNTDSQGHYRICKTCGENIMADGETIGKDAHTQAAAVEENRVNATCLADGSYDTVIYCSECGYEISRTGHTIPALGHAYGVWTDYDDENQHKRVCANDATHIDYADHDWSGWQHVVPTEDETGIRATVRAKLTEAGYSEESSCFNYCTVCGYTKIQAHPDFVVVQDETVTYPATCEAAGQTTSECPDCGKTKVETIKALGHDPTILHKAQAPTDNSPGVVYFECSRGCRTFFSAKDEGGKYVAGAQAASESKAQQSGARIPAPTFNSFSDGDIGYNYSTRGASLKLAKETDKDGDTIQKMRFSGSVVVPDGLSTTIDAANLAKYNAGNLNAIDDNSVIDFGFIYTQHQYVLIEGDEYYTPDLTKLDHWADADKLYHMSVVSKNTGNFYTDQEANEWTGVTAHPEGNALTFNLLLNVKQKNWKTLYIARTYIIYKYHGEVYTVFDGYTDLGGGVSDRAVWSVAAQLYAAYQGTSLGNYLTDYILNEASEAAISSTRCIDWYKFPNEEGLVDEPTLEELGVL